MKKSAIFLINGLGIEKPGSYSISIDQAMPNLSRIKETSYFTTAITSSLEPRGAYQRFFLGDTYDMELDYIGKNVINENIVNNTTYRSFYQNARREKTKLHFFVEPNSDKVVEQINKLVTMLNLEENHEVYLHLILSQLTTAEYKSLITRVNYIKFHLNSRITAGFIIGKESISQTITKPQLDYMKKLLFMCSAERWSETEKKLLSLEEEKIRPCDALGFCTNNDCFIEASDTIVFFNTRSENYDNFIHAIMDNAKTYFKEDIKLSIYSLVKLYSSYNIMSFIDKMEYENNFANLLERNDKKALIITDEENIPLVNFYANGLQSKNNPRINFMTKNEHLFEKEYLEKLMNESVYDLIIFDYYMDVSSTIHHLKEELSKIDIIIGVLGEVSENKHSLFITSLFGLKKTLKVADYLEEEATIDYEMQIPIFFFDYTFPHGKYILVPGETNDILTTALRCLIYDPNIRCLLLENNFMNNLFHRKG